MNTKNSDMSDYKPEYWEAMKDKLDLEMPVSIFQNPFVKWGFITTSMATVTTACILIFNQADQKVGVIPTETKVLPLTEEKVIVQPDENSSTINSNSSKVAVISTFEDETPLASLPIAQTSSPLSEVVIQKNAANEIIIQAPISNLEPTVEPKSVVNSEPGLIRPMHEMVAPIQATTVSESEIKEVTSTENDKLTDELNAKMESTLQETSGTIQNPSLTVEESVTTDIQGTEQERKLAIFLNIGVNGTYGYNNRNLESKSSIDPIVGIGYRLYLADPWSVSVSLNWMQRGGSNLSREQSTSTFFLDKVVTSTSVRTYRLNYLHVPVRLGYRHGKHHRVSLGGFYSYVLDSRSEVTTSISSTFSETITEQHKSNGYMKGLNRHQYGITLDYEFILSPSLGFGLSLNQGLSPGVQEGTFNGVKNNQSTDLQLSIRYSLFK